MTLHRTRCKRFKKMYHHIARLTIASWTNPVSQEGLVLVSAMCITDECMDWKEAEDLILLVQEKLS